MFRTARLIVSLLVLICLVILLLVCLFGRLFEFWSGESPTSIFGDKMELKHPNILASAEY